MRILFTLALGLNIVGLSRADNFLELYESAPQTHFRLEDVHFTPEQETRFEEEFRIEKEQMAKDLRAQLDLIYDERMEKVQIKRLQSVALPDDFVNGFIQDPISGKQAYQFFDENLGIIRMFSLENALYFIVGAICAYLSTGLREAVLDELFSTYDAFERFTYYIEIFVKEYNANAGYKATMKNLATIYDSLKSHVRNVMQTKLTDKIMHLAKKFLGISFILALAEMVWRITTNILKITDLLNEAYDWYSVAEANEDYFNSGWYTGEAGAIVFY
ncbi:hypothetical protein FGO68_gene9895 [Halteria grandinella]|uniref:Uncharacterized protein n=1 Tax=Halteria grandinella TaxID=5974 RepID=A0A8J8NL24_HALGN|nr:hypothetical protein FGO68_gene9895 [Halteria grandinella]